jgi:hypothetical protein
MVRGLDAVLKQVWVDVGHDDANGRGEPEPPGRADRAAPPVHHDLLNQGIVVGATACAHVKGSGSGGRCGVGADRTGVSNRDRRCEDRAPHGRSWAGQGLTWRTPASAQQEKARQSAQRRRHGRSPLKMGRKTAGFVAVIRPAGYSFRGLLS